jgi:hypothetical protein
MATSVLPESDASTAQITDVAGRGRQHQREEAAGVEERDLIVRATRVVGPDRASRRSTSGRAPSDATTDRPSSVRVQPRRLRNTMVSRDSQR